MKEGGEVHAECIGELKDVRQSLMEDFKISPDIVDKCESEISEHCGGGLHRSVRSSILNVTNHSLFPM